MENTVKERLEAYLQAKKISKSEFGRSVGVSSAYVSAIKRSIDKDKLLKMREVYPDLNQDWLIYGVGDMIIGQNSGAVVQGNNNTNNNINSDGPLEMALSEIAEQRKLTAKAQEQMDSLLQIITNLSKR